MYSVGQDSSRVAPPPQLTSNMNQSYRKDEHDKHATPPPAIKQANNLKKLPETIRDQMGGGNHSPKHIQQSQYSGNAKKQLALSNNPSGSSNNANNLPRPNMKNRE